MGSTQPFLRRAFAVALAPAVVVGGLALATTAAIADPVNPTPVSSSPLPTVQIDGVAWTQYVVDGVDYVGGQFTSSRPAGAAAGSSETARGNLLAYDVSTGVAIPGFDATTNGAVRAITSSPDGSIIYIAGLFTQVNGQSRSHVAALSPSGALLPFSVQTNGVVNALALRGSTLFLGGTFTAAGGKARLRAAAVTTSGALLDWAPQVSDGNVKGIAISPSADTVLLGGSFSSVNGGTRRGLAAVTYTTGASKPWAANGVVSDGDVNSGIFSLSTRGSVVYASGFAWQGGAAGTHGNLEGVIAMRWADGGTVWIENCRGDSYSVTPFNDAVYTASHSHDCSDIGGFVQTNPISYHRAMGFSQAATHTAVGGPFVGKPAPSILDWMPDFNVGTFTGLSQGPWSVTSGSGYLVYGGEFTKVDGTKQQGLVRFQGVADSADPVSTPTAPPTTPTTGTPAVVPNRVSHPNAVPLGPTRVAVKWSAPKAAASAKITGYTVKVYKGSKLVRTVKVSSSKRSAVVGGLTRSTSYSVGVAAVNKQGAGKLSVLDAAKTRAKGKNVSATKKPSKVSKPKASVGTARFRVRWSAASTKGALGVTSYQIRIVKAGKTVKVITVDDAVRSRLITKLSRHATYTVSVRASSWAGWGAWSAAKKLRTR